MYTRKHIFLATLIQSIIIVVGTILLVQNATGLTCTGNAQSCASVTQSLGSFSLIAAAVLSIYYGLISLLAYWYSRRGNVVAAVMLVIVQVAIAFQGLTSLAQPTTNKVLDVFMLISGLIIAAAAMNTRLRKQNNHPIS